MSSIHLYDHLADGDSAHGPQPTPTPAAHGLMPQQVLRQTGGRPLAFRGRLVASATGWSTAGSLWHELNLFRTDDGRFVSDIRVFKKAQNDHDSFHVQVCDSLDEALAVFEGHDARGDVGVSIDLCDDATPAAELVIKAAYLKAELAFAQQRYQAVLGRFLHDLGEQLAVAA